MPSPQNYPAIWSSRADCTIPKKDVILSAAKDLSPYITGRGKILRRFVSQDDMDMRAAQLSSVSVTQCCLISPTRA